MSGYQQLNADLAANRPKRLYVFYGEEDYLKSAALERLRRLICGDLDEFNYSFLEGTGLKLQQFADTIGTLPLGSERKLVVIRDFKLLPPPAEFKEALPGLLEDLPEDTCLVFYFDTVEFKADKRQNLYKQLEALEALVHFEKAHPSDLIPWIKRRFYSLDKKIDTGECEYLIFVSGASMQNLITEIDKIAAGTPGGQIARSDIDALASRVLEADIFALTDCILARNDRRALLILRDLFDMKEEPVRLMGAITRQVQRLYGAALMREAGKGEKELAALVGFRSAYPAKMLLKGVGKTSLEQLRAVQSLCLEYEMLIKSNLPDTQRTCELFLMRLGRALKA